MDGGSCVHRMNHHRAMFVLFVTNSADQILITGFSFDSPSAYWSHQMIFTFSKSQEGTINTVLDKYRLQQMPTRKFQNDKSGTVLTCFINST
jgi:hypothetical protein